jgi:TonB family protein
MLHRLKLSLILFIVATVQAQTPDTVIAGPYGVPRLVRTEGGQWSEPVQVFSNTDEVVYVPDITTSGWAQWHEQDFKERGLYFTYIYTYWRKRQVTVRELVYVNTQTQQVRVERFLKPTVQMDLRTSSPAISKTVANITKIVQDSIERFNGPSMQSVLNSDKYVTLRNSFCAAQTPDCYLDSEALRKKYPLSTPSNSGFTSAQVISSVAPEYPAEARANKAKGNVVVHLVIDTQGRPQNISVPKPVGNGLDEAAIKAVQQYVFKPAMQNGVPVTMELNVSVNFQLF